MSNTYKRPDSNYNTKTSSKHANRFKEQPINKTVLKGEVLDDEFNSTIDSLNDLDQRVTDLSVGLFPGSNDPANANNIIYSDGREAKFGKVTANLMANNSVGTDQLQYQSVTNDQMGLNSISNAEIMDNAITTPKIMNNAITEPKIMNNAITTSKISNGAVTTPKIDDNAITTSKISNGAVTTEKIAPKSVDSTRINYDNIYFLGELKYVIGIFLKKVVAVQNWLLLTHTNTDFYQQNKEMYSANKWTRFAKEQPQFVFDGYLKFDIFLNKFHFIASPEVNVADYIDNFKNFSSSNPYYAYLKNNPNIRGGTVGTFEGIKIGVENMPAHNHNVILNVENILGQNINAPALDYGRKTSSRNEVITKTSNTGLGNELQWLPPGQMVFAYMYMGYPAY